MGRFRFFLVDGAYLRTAKNPSELNFEVLLGYTILLEGSSLIPYLESFYWKHRVKFTFTLTNYIWESSIFSFLSYSHVLCPRLVTYQFTFSLPNYIQGTPFFFLLTLFECTMSPRMTRRTHKLSRTRSTLKIQVYLIRESWSWPLRGGRGEVFRKVDAPGWWRWPRGRPPGAGSSGSSRTASAGGRVVLAWKWEWF